MKRFFAATTTTTLLGRLCLLFVILFGGLLFGCAFLTTTQSLANPLDDDDFFDEESSSFSEEMVFASLGKKQRFGGVDQKRDDDGFEDEDDVLFQSLFSWTTTAARKGEEMEDLRDLNTFPRAIARLVADGTKGDDDVLETKKFSVGFTRGRWKESVFGRKPMNFDGASALGMHVNGAFRENNNEEEDERRRKERKKQGWIKLTNTVGARLCAGANVKQRGLPRFYEAGGGIEFGSNSNSNSNGNSSSGSGSGSGTASKRATRTLFQSYPKEIACVENVASFFEMLPCGGRRGVASVMSERSALVAEVKFLSFGASYEKGKFSMFMTGVASREVVEKMVSEKKEVKACPAAKEVSRVYVLLGDGDVRAVDLREGKSNIAELLTSLKKSMISSSSSTGVVDLPRVTITRAVLGSGNIRGVISLSMSRFENARGDIVVRIFHPIPDYVRVFRHTFKVVSKGNLGSVSSSDGSIVSDITWRKGLLEMKVTLRRALDSVTITFDFEKIFLPLELFEADAERGMTFPPAIAFSAPVSDEYTVKQGRYESARNKLGFNISPLFEKLLENEQNDFAHFLDAFTVILPVPDGAMPFNATAMACAAFVAHLVALSKVLTKRENYDEKAKTLRRLAKAVEKKKKTLEDAEKKKATKGATFFFRRVSFRT
tara:strand:- start:2189 stop:4165 length:1977 start_codon:yes stop_codon:yes gene_type:complete